MQINLTAGQINLIVWFVRIDNRMWFETIATTKNPPQLWLRLLQSDGVIWPSQFLLIGNCTPINPVKCRQVVQFVVLLWRCVQAKQTYRNEQSHICIFCCLHRSKSNVTRTQIGWFHLAWEIECVVELIRYQTMIITRGRDLIRILIVPYFNP